MGRRAGLTAAELAASTGETLVAARAREVAANLAARRALPGTGTRVAEVAGRVATLMTEKRASASSVTPRASNSRRPGARDARRRGAGATDPEIPRRAGTTRSGVRSRLDRMLVLARAIVASASARIESRGGPLSQRSSDRRVDRDSYRGALRGRSPLHARSHARSRCRMKVELRVRRQASPDADPYFVVYELEAAESDSVWDCPCDDRAHNRSDADAAARQLASRRGLRRLWRPRQRTRDARLHRAGRCDRWLTHDRASRAPSRRARSRRPRAGPRHSRHVRARRAARDVVADGDLAAARTITACHQCGLCESVCVEDFKAGPAAMAWNYRFLSSDPRDGARALMRLAAVAGCVECGACDVVCPEHVAPLAWIRRAKDVR